MKVETRELTPALWSDVVRLFGPEGADGGCWCMSWRSQKEVQGDEARDCFETLVRRGEAQGILAYVDGEPVGWCTFGLRSSFYHAAKMFASEAAPSHDAWAIPCFFISARFRRRGLAKILLRAAVAAIHRKGGRKIEGYPVASDVQDETQRRDWSFTGPFEMFKGEAFQSTGLRLNGGLMCVRREELSHAGKNKSSEA